MEQTGQQSNHFLVSEPIGKLMLRYALPCTISLLVAALYNIVDQIFIANAADLGSAGNAANTVVFPLTVVALAIAVMIGDGCCAFVSIRLGAGKDSDVHHGVGTAIVLCLGLSFALTVLYLLCGDALLTLFGGRVNPETFAHAKTYFFWIAIGIPFYMFGQALNPIIRSDGSPRFAMMSTLAGAAVNVILDPIFIFGCHWGMAGAAIATVLGQMLTAFLSVWYLFYTKNIRLSRESFRVRWNLAWQILSLGLCSFLAQISLVAAMAAINNMLRQYGARDKIFGQEAYAQIPMAVVGIVMKFFQIVISISIGMAAGCIPIVGYNIGAGHQDRAEKLLYRLIFLEALVGAAATLVAECFPRQLISIFGAANESVHYTEFAVRSFRIYLCTMTLACINKAAFIYLQSLGKAFASTMLSMVREVVFGVGFALLLPHFFAIDGVLYSMPAADILTSILSCVCLYKAVKLLRSPREKVIRQNG